MGNEQISINDFNNRSPGNHCRHCGCDLPNHRQSEAIQHSPTGANQPAPRATETETKFRRSPAISPTGANQSARDCAQQPKRGSRLSAFVSTTPAHPGRQPLGLTTNQGFSSNERSRRKEARLLSERPSPWLRSTKSRNKLAGIVTVIRFGTRKHVLVP